MTRDPTSWLGTLEPEKPRNARSWAGSTGDPEITPVSEIQRTARKQPVDTFSVGQSTERKTEKAPAAPAKVAKFAPEDVDDLNASIPSQAHRLTILRAALARGDDPADIREAWPTWWAFGSGTATEKMWHRDNAAAREATPVVAEETPMPKGMPIAPKRNAVSDVERVARRDRLRSHLETNGPTTREALRSALGYGHESAGKQLLNKDLEHLGAKGIPGEAVSLPGQGAGPIASEPPKKMTAWELYTRDHPGKVVPKVVWVVEDSLGWMLNAYDDRAVAQRDADERNAALRFGGTGTTTHVVDYRTISAPEPPMPSGPGFFPMAPPSPSDINAVIDRRNAERVEAEKAQGLDDALDAALTAFAEASIDLDKALDRHAKAKAAVLAAAEEKRPR